MSRIDDTVARIRAERERRWNAPVAEVAAALGRGEVTEAVARVLFRAKDEDAFIDAAEADALRLFEGGAAAQRAQVLSFFMQLAIDYAGSRPRWVKQPVERSKKLSARFAARTEELAGRDGAAAALLTEQLRAETLGRLQAEAVDSADQRAALAAELLGPVGGAAGAAGGAPGAAGAAGPVRFMRGVIDEISRSNFRVAAEAWMRGESATVVGNDYAAYSLYTLWIGGSSITSNPVLIKLAWDADRATYDPLIDAIIKDLLSPAEIRAAVAASGEEQAAVVRRLNTRITMAVVEQNCRLIRDIFLATDGMEGYVNLQVNPRNYSDAAGMVAEASAVYDELDKALGGVPNVVIKLPATPASLEAARQLTARGIGVTITLCFSLAQTMAFGEVLRHSQALVSNMAVMNGRLANPVKAQLAEMGVAGGDEAAQWTGVAVSRKVYARLYNPAAKGGMGLDPKRVRLMIASLRIYGDWLPDITELWGVPAITVFPNARRALDLHPRPFEPNTVQKETPAAPIETLLKSEIFRQAWWTGSEGAAAQPAAPLQMTPAGAAAVAAWAPVEQTLRQFIAEYEAMSGMVVERLRRLV